MNILRMLLRDLRREKQSRQIEQESSRYLQLQGMIQLKDIPPIQNNMDPPMQKDTPATNSTMEDADKIGFIDDSDALEAQYFEYACQMAKAFCIKHSLTYVQKGPFIYVTTGAGKWYFCPHPGKSTTSKITNCSGINPKTTMSSSKNDIR